MSKREIIAYAITHAPPGVKGGPYWAHAGGRTSDIRASMRFSPEGIRAATNAANHADARVIRIVRKARPSEASAVEVLRELVAKADACAAYERLDVLGDIVQRARAVLAASAPDPMPVVRAAMRETEAEEAFDRVAVKGRSMNAEADAICVARANRVAAVDAYRKAGGK